MSSVSAQEQDKPHQDPISISNQDPQEVDLDKLRTQLSEIRKKVKQQAEAQTEIKKKLDKFQNDRTKLGGQLKNLDLIKAQLKSIREIAKQVQLQKEGLAELLQKAIEKLNKQPLPTGYAKTLKMLENNTESLGSNLKLNRAKVSKLRDAVLKMEASIRGMDAPKVISTIHEFDPLKPKIMKSLKPQGVIQLHGLSNDLAAFDKISTIEFDDDSKSLILFGDRRGKWLRVSLKLDNDGKLIGLNYHERGSVRKSGGKRNTPLNPLDDIESSAWFQGKLHLGLDNGEIYRLNDNWVAEKLNENLSGFKTELIKNKQVIFEDSGIEGMTATEDGKTLICFAEKQRAESGNAESRQAWVLTVGVKGENIKQRKVAYEFDDAISGRHDIGGATTHKGKVIVVHKHFDKDSKLNLVRISRFHIDDLAKKKSGTVLLKAKSKNLLDNTECIVSFAQNEKNYLALLTDNNGKSKQRTIFHLFELITPDKTAPDKAAPEK